MAAASARMLSSLRSMSSGRSMINTTGGQCKPRPKQRNYRDRARRDQTFNVFKAFEIVISGDRVFNEVCVHIAVVVAVDLGERSGIC